MSKEPTRLKPRSQFAALPWRGAGDGVEVLMITSRQSRHWLIPKGWPMRGKSDSQAAAREALEEAGIKGTMSPVSIGSYEYDKLRLGQPSLRCRVEVFPLEVVKELAEWPETLVRERRWLSLAEAAELAFEPGLGALLASLGPAAFLAGGPRVERKKERR